MSTALAMENAPPTDVLEMAAQVLRDRVRSLQTSAEDMRSSSHEEDRREAAENSDEAADLLIAIDWLNDVVRARS